MSFLRHRIGRIVLAVLAAAILCSLASAMRLDAMKRMSYQFRATNSDGSPVADGPHDLIFMIFPDAISSVPLWSESQSVETTDGFGAATLGDVVALPVDVFSSADTTFSPYLAVTLDGEEISPRTRLTAAPYARVAERVVGDYSTGEGYFLMALGTSLNQKFDTIATEVTTTAAGTAALVDTGGPAYLSVDNTQAGEERLITMSTTPRATPLKKLKDLVNAVETSIESVGEHTAAGIGVTGSRGAMRATWGDGSDSTDFMSFATEDSTGTIAGMNKADLIDHIATKATTTKEHVLLSRQVGVPDATENRTAELQTNNGGSSLSLNSNDQTRSDDIWLGIEDNVASLDLEINDPSFGTSGVHASGANKRGTVRPYDLSPAGDSAVITIEASTDGSKFEIYDYPGEYALGSSVSSSRSALALFGSSDTAAVTEATSDKRKQSLYFPESLLSATEIVVDGFNSSLSLSELVPTTKALFTGFTATGSGDVTAAGDVEIGGDLDMSTTSGALIVPRLTTSQRSALTPVNGMIIYNLSTNQFNFYENGAWVTK